MVDGFNMQDTRKRDGAFRNANCGEHHDCLLKVWKKGQNLNQQQFMIMFEDQVSNPTNMSQLLKFVRLHTHAQGDIIFTHQTVEICSKKDADKFDSTTVADFTQIDKMTQFCLHRQTKKVIDKGTIDQDDDMFDQMTPHIECKICDILEHADQQEELELALEEDGLDDLMMAKNLSKKIIEDECADDQIQQLDEFLSNVKEVEPRSGEIRQTLSDKPTFSMVSSEEFSEMPKDFDPELLDMRSKMLTKLKNRMSALDPPSN